MNDFVVVSWSLTFNIFYTFSNGFIVELEHEIPARNVSNLRIWVVLIEGAQNQFKVVCWDTQHQQQDCWSILSLK